MTSTITRTRMDLEFAKWLLSPGEIVSANPQSGPVHVPLWGGVEILSRAGHVSASLNMVYPSTGGGGRHKGVFELFFTFYGVHRCVFYNGFYWDSGLFGEKVGFKVISAQHPHCTLHKRSTPHTAHSTLPTLRAPPRSAHSQLRTPHTPLHTFGTPNTLHTPHQNGNHPNQAYASHQNPT